MFSRDISRTDAPDRPGVTQIFSRESAIPAPRQIPSPDSRWQIMSSWSSDANFSVSAPLPPPL